MKLKKAKVVMLPTDENQHPTLLLNPSINKLERPKHEHKYPASEYKKAGYQCYDLYFIGYDKVTKPCWVFNENGVGKENKLFEVKTDIAIGNCAIHNWNEVVASSAGLGHTSKSFYKQFGHNVEETKLIYLPQPSNGFVNVFINLYNKGELIKFVNIEYLRNVTIVDEKQWENNELILNINSKDNTITIRAIKDSWNRNEIIDLLHKHTEFMLSGKKLTLDEWIEENL